VSARRKLSRPQAQTAAVLGPLDGARVPGGCASCDAFQKVAPLSAGVWSVQVFHDDDCPVLAAHQGGPK
jgi:hypothetical protein